MLQHDVEINCHVIVREVNVHAAPIVFWAERLNHAEARMLCRDAHDTVALRNRSTGDGGDGARGNLDPAWSPTAGVVLPGIMVDLGRETLVFASAANVKAAGHMRPPADAR